MELSGETLAQHAQNPIYPTHSIANHHCYYYRHHYHCLGWALGMCSAAQRLSSIHEALALVSSVKKKKSRAGQINFKKENSCVCVNVCVCIYTCKCAYVFECGDQRTTFSVISQAPSTFETQLLIGQDLTNYVRLPGQAVPRILQSQSSQGQD